MITATEAAILSKSQKKKAEDVFYVIRIVAAGGKTSATFVTEELSNEDDIHAKLLNAGFELDVSSPNFLTVNW